MKMDLTDKDYIKVMKEWVKERKMGIKEARTTAAHYRKVAQISLDMAESSEVQARLQETIMSAEMVE